MGKITKEMIEASYEFARDVYEGKTSKNRRSMKVKCCEIFPSLFDHLLPYLNGKSEAQDKLRSCQGRLEYRIIDER